MFRWMFNRFLRPFGGGPAPTPPAVVNRVVFAGTITRRRVAPGSITRRRVFQET